MKSNERQIEILNIKKVPFGKILIEGYEIARSGKMYAFRVKLKTCDLKIVDGIGYVKPGIFKLNWFIPKEKYESVFIKKVEKKSLFDFFKPL